jgi:hypothetical protein
MENLQVGMVKKTKPIKANLAAQEGQPVAKAAGIDTITFLRILRDRI